VLDAYLASERFAAKAPSTQAIDRGRIERHLRPLLGRTHVHTLTPGGVERAFAAIRVGRTATVVKTRARGKARVTGGEGTAREAIHLLRAVLAWGVRGACRKRWRRSHDGRGPALFQTLLTSGSPKQTASSRFCSRTVQAPAKPKPLRSHSMASKPWIVRRAVGKA
jgi:hypothetical protein